MAAHHDTGEFVDSDFQSAQQNGRGAPLGEPAAPAPAASNRPPTREEIEALVSEKQIKLAELKRAQEELERERAGLEELRRRQAEFQTGRAEMLQHLTRGIGLLEEAELNSRRDAEQMARTLAEFRSTVAKVQSVNEQAWTQENFSMELTRASTTIENARMEWNSARLKFPLLAGAPSSEPAAAPEKSPAPLLQAASLTQLSKIGLAFTWPLVLLGAAIFLILLFRR
jgi:DNA repair exonuclease SbcCD ATPase subunit